MKSLFSTLVLLLTALPSLGQAFESVEVGEGEWPDIVINGAGDRFIGFVREIPPGSIWLAAETAPDGSFELEKVVQNRIHGPTQILLDDQGVIRLGLHDHNLEGFGMWIQNPLGWTFEGVEDDGHDGWDPDFQMDTSGGLHVSTIDPGGGPLPSAIEYAYDSGSGWVVERVAESPMTYGNGTSLAFLDTNKPRIAYFEPEKQDLMLASRSSSGWSVVSVDTTGDVGRYASLAIDEAGVYHLAYLQWNGDSTGEVIYSHNTSGEWERQSIDTLDNLFVARISARHNVALLLDDSGLPVIVYSDQKVARIARPGVSESSIETVVDYSGTDVILGQYISFAFGPEGREHIVYHQANEDSAPNTVMMATRSQSTDIDYHATRDLDDAFEVFPNPSSDQARFTFYSERSQVVQIEILDLLGRIVERDEVTVAAGTQIVRVPTRQWQAGVYVVRVSTGTEVRTSLMTRIR